MDAPIIDLSLWDLATVYSLLLMSIGLAHLLKANQGKDLFWSGLRMFVQLLLVGYVLHLVFALESALPVLLIPCGRYGNPFRLWGHDLLLLHVGDWSRTLVRPALSDSFSGYGDW
jgi:hypothetical protein